MVASALMTVGKFTIGIMTGSLGLILEGLHSLLDFFATFLTSVAVRVGSGSRELSEIQMSGAVARRSPTSLKVTAFGQTARWGRFAEFGSYPQGSILATAVSARAHTAGSVKAGLFR